MQTLGSLVDEKLNEMFAEGVRLGACIQAIENEVTFVGRACPYLLDPVRFAYSITSTYNLADFMYNYDHSCIWEEVQ